MILIILGGGGYWTRREGWQGPNVSGLLWVLFVVVLLVVVVRLLGVV